MSISNYSNYKSALTTMESNKSTAASGIVSKVSSEVGVCIVDSNGSNVWFIEIDNMTDTNGDISVGGPCIHLYFAKPTGLDASTIVSQMSVWDGNPVSLISRCPWITAGQLRKMEIYGDYNAAIPFTLNKAIKNGTLDPTDDNTIYAFDADFAQKATRLLVCVPNIATGKIFMQAHGDKSIFELTS